MFMLNKPSQNQRLNTADNIPVIIQNARFRVLEQFQFEARTPYFFDAAMIRLCPSTSAMGLKTIYASLLILLREQAFYAIKALPKSFIIFRVKTSKKNSHNVTNH